MPLRVYRRRGKIPVAYAPPVAVEGGRARDGHLHRLDPRTLRCACGFSEPLRVDRFDKLRLGQERTIAAHRRLQFRTNIELDYPAEIPLDDHPAAPFAFWMERR